MLAKQTLTNRAISTALDFALWMTSVLCLLCLCSCEQVPGVSFLGGLLPFVLVESVKWLLRQDSSPTSGSHCLKVSAVAGS